MKFAEGVARGRRGHVPQAAHQLPAAPGAARGLAVPGAHPASSRPDQLASDLDGLEGNDDQRRGSRDGDRSDDHWSTPLTGLQADDRAARPRHDRAGRDELAQDAPLHRDAEDADLPVPVVLRERPRDPAGTGHDADGPHPHEHRHLLRARRRASRSRRTTCGPRTTSSATGRTTHAVPVGWIKIQNARHERARDAAFEVRPHRRSESRSHYGVDSSFTGWDLDGDGNFNLPGEIPPFKNEVSRPLPRHAADGRARRAAPGSARASGRSSSTRRSQGGDYVRRGPGNLRPGRAGHGHPLEGLLLQERRPRRGPGPGLQQAGRQHHAR